MEYVTKEELATVLERYMTREELASMLKKIFETTIVEDFGKLENRVSNVVNLIKELETNRLQNIDEINKNFEAIAGSFRLVDSNFKMLQDKFESLDIKIETGLESVTKQLESLTKQIDSGFAMLEIFDVEHRDRLRSLEQKVGRGKANS